MSINQPWPFTTVSNADGLMTTRIVPSGASDLAASYVIAFLQVEESVTDAVNT